MTNEQAIEILRRMRSEIANDREWLALDRAIEALKKMDLIRFNVYALNDLLKEAEQ